jgi:hypothetical protein
MEHIKFKQIIYSLSVPANPAKNSGYASEQNCYDMRMKGWGTS